MSQRCQQRRDGGDSASFPTGERHSPHASPTVLVQNQTSSSYPTSLSNPPPDRSTPVAHAREMTTSVGQSHTCQSRHAAQRDDTTTADLGLCFRMPTRLADGFGPEAGPTRRRGAIHPSEANIASIVRGEELPPRLDPPSPGHATGEVRRDIGTRLVADTSMRIDKLYPSSP